MATDKVPSDRRKSVSPFFFHSAFLTSVTVSMVDDELFDKVVGGSPVCSIPYLTFSRTILANRFGKIIDHSAAYRSFDLCFSPTRALIHLLQLVVSGDFFQLPPVVNASKIKAKFAFEARCWKTCFDKTYKLTQVFRQSDGGMHM